MNFFKKSLILACVGFLCSASIAFASFDSNIKYGTVRSDAVREIQEFLTDQGLYSGPVTGNFYTLTLRAVKAFQNREGIKPANGYWGPPTRSRAKDLAAAEIDDSNQEAEQTGENSPLSDNDVAIRFPDGSTYNSNGKQLSPPTPIEQNFSNDLCNNFQGVQLTPPAGYMPASNGDCVIIPPTVVYVPISAPVTSIPVIKPILIPAKKSFTKDNIADVNGSEIANGVKIVISPWPRESYPSPFDIITTVTKLTLTDTSQTTLQFDSYTSFNGFVFYFQDSRIRKGEPYAYTFTFENRDYQGSASGLWVAYQ